MKSDVLKNRIEKFNNINQKNKKILINFVIMELILIMIFCNMLTRKEDGAALSVINLKEELKAPNSLQIHEIRYYKDDGLDDDGLDSILIDYSSENSYGGMVRSIAKFTEYGLLEGDTSDDYYTDIEFSDYYSKEEIKKVAMQRKTIAEIKLLWNYTDDYEIVNKNKVSRNLFQVQSEKGKIFPNFDLRDTFRYSILFIIIIVLIIGIFAYRKEMMQ